MKIVLNHFNLELLMRNRDFKTYRQLCNEAGIDYYSFKTAKSRNSLSKETYYLIAETLNCHVEELQMPDWEK